MAQRVYIPLYQREIEALVRLSQHEDRDPRSQAARFVREGLKHAGVLTDERSATPITTTSRGPEAAA